jgi:hypothetical protein
MMLLMLPGVAEKVCVVPSVTPITVLPDWGWIVTVSLPLPEMVKVPVAATQLMGLMLIIIRDSSPSMPSWVECRSTRAGYLHFLSRFRA